MRDDAVIANIDLLAARSKIGIAKYGTTLSASGLGHRALLMHALEEALDLANYLQASIMELDRKAAAYADLFDNRSGGRHPEPDETRRRDHDMDTTKGFAPE